MSEGASPVIGFAGMTHLGINSAVAVAEKGFPTIGYDPDRDIVTRLEKGDPIVSEPNLKDALHSTGPKMRFSSDPAILNECDIIYISTDVPTDDTGKSDLLPIISLIETVSAHLHKQALLVVLCQVPPGFSRTIDLPPERLYYQVETLIFGRALDRARYPERYIIGCAEPAAPLAAALDELLSAFECPILPMRYESAELAKISINCCLVAQVSAANTLAEICESIGADWDEVVPALRLDKRIGQFAYLNAGLGISGGNLERDLATIVSLSEKHETDGDIVRAWLANSTHRKNWPYKILAEHILPEDPDPRITVLGLAYKENTHSTKNSPALKLLDNLQGKQVTVHDPVVDLSIVPWAETAASVEEAVQNTDILIIMTPWQEYRDFLTRNGENLLTRMTIIDPYRLLSQSEQGRSQKHSSLYQIGKG